MNTYLIIIWDPTQDPTKVVYMHILEEANAADAKTEAEKWRERRPDYKVNVIKMD